MLNQIRFSRGTSQPADGENVLNANAGNCHRSALEPRIFGWFEGPGIKGSLEQLRARKIPQVIAWLIIIGQSFGSIALILGFMGRVAAGGLFIITGALIVHVPDGWTLNWFGEKNGEGIEYFVMLLSLLLIIILKGSGALSIDLWLIPKI